MGFISDLGSKEGGLDESAEAKELRAGGTSNASAVHVAGPGVAGAAGNTASPPEHIMQFFAFSHLPPVLAKVSEPFAVLASHIVVTCPRNPERTVALRKLLEAKDACVRAVVAK